ncbi:MAG: CHAT domain-containing protein, partial [Acidimicrobiia bacterium]
ISPVGRLHAVPWSALPSLRGRPVSVIPSAAAWLRDRPKGSSPPALVAGPGLDHARGEVKAVQGLWPGASVLAGKKATVTSVLDALNGASIAHLVAHGRFRTDNPMFTSLMLADGPLSLYDLEELEAPPETVVLSACEVGSSVVRLGDELLGMAAAFLEMGSKAVIAPLFPVSDAATRAVMEVVHDHLASGSTPATALAEARRTESPEERLSASSFLCFG